MNKIFLVAAINLFVSALISAAEPASQPAAGTAAPDFSLTTGDGSQVTLKDYHGKWVVLYFYPKDFTGGCPLPAKKFFSGPSQNKKKGGTIFCGWVGRARTHKKFFAEEGVGF